MCQEFTILARQDQTHYIARCRHGAIHLNWNRATLRLQPAELVEIAQFLTSAVEKIGDEPACCGNQHHCLVYDAYGYFQVWLLSLGLYMNAFAFSLFLDTLANAVEAMLSPLPPPSADSCPNPARTQLFSIN